MDIPDERKRCCASLVCADCTHDIQYKSRDIYHSGYQSAEKRYYSKYASWCLMNGSFLSPSIYAARKPIHVKYATAAIRFLFIFYLLPIGESADLFKR